MREPIIDPDRARRLRVAIRADLVRYAGQPGCDAEDGRTLYESRVAPALRGLWSEP